MFYLFYELKINLIWKLRFDEATWGPVKQVNSLIVKLITLHLISSIETVVVLSKPFPLIFKTWPPYTLPELGVIWLIDGKPVIWTGFGLIEFPIPNYEIFF